MAESQREPSSLTSNVPGESLFSTFPWLCRPEYISALYAGLALVATIPPLFRLGFDNFDIFRYSFLHLVRGGGLYVHYPVEPGDLFKYSPTFALVMAPFWLAPKWIGLPVWNLLNAFGPLVMVKRLALSQRARAFILIFCAVELLISLQNLQSNGLVAALMIGTFVAFERDQPVVAALFVCLAFYIKIFGISAAILFILYQQRMKFLIACVMIGGGLGLLPALLIGFDGLASQYLGWLNLLSQDQLANNLSLMGFIDDRLGLKLPNVWFQSAGAVLLLLPLFCRQSWTDFGWRLRYLSSLLMWVVVFNHKTESPTFVIAMFGVALWAVVEPPSLARSILLILAFVLTSLSSTDFVPRYFRQRVVRPLAVKAVPIFVLWAHSVWRLASGTR